MAKKKNEEHFTTIEENLKNRILFLEGELMVIKEKAKVLAKLPPLTITIDEQTRAAAQDMVKYIEDIKGIGSFT